MAGLWLMKKGINPILSRQTKVLLSTPIRIMNMSTYPCLVMFIRILAVARQHSAESLNGSS